MNGRDTRLARSLVVEEHRHDQEHALILTLKDWEIPAMENPKKRGIATRNRVPIVSDY